MLLLKFTEELAKCPEKQLFLKNKLERKTTLHTHISERQMVQKVMSLTVHTGPFKHTFLNELRPQDIL